VFKELGTVYSDSCNRYTNILCVDSWHSGCDSRYMLGCRGL